VSDTCDKKVYFQEVSDRRRGELGVIRRQDKWRSDKAFAFPVSGFYCIFAVWRDEAGCFCFLSVGAWKFPVSLFFSLFLVTFV